jgi:hypothetical protein
MKDSQSRSSESSQLAWGWGSVAFKKVIAAGSFWAGATELPRTQLSNSLPCLPAFSALIIAPPRSPVGNGLASTVLLGPGAIVEEGMSDKLGALGPPGRREAFQHSLLRLATTSYKSLCMEQRA